MHVQIDVNTAEELSPTDRAVLAVLAFSPAAAQTVVDGAQSHVTRDLPEYLKDAADAAATVGDWPEQRPDNSPKGDTAVGEAVSGVADMLASETTATEEKPKRKRRTKAEMEAARAAEAAENETPVAENQADDNAAPSGSQSDGRAVLAAAHAADDRHKQALLADAGESTGPAVLEGDPRTEARINGQTVEPKLTGNGQGPSMELDTVSLAELKEAASKAIGAGRRETVQAALTAVGASRISEISADKRAEFVAAINA